MKKILFLFSSLIMQFTYAQSPFPLEGAMDKYTVFGFSQYWLNQADTQIFYLKPDMNMRAWAQWDKDGTIPGNYNFPLVDQHHNQSIGFMGGLTATVYFYDQAGDSAVFKDMVTRDAYGKLVPHNNIVPGAFRSNIANPAFRNYVIGIAKIQLDGGVDGIYFDEVLSGYNGLTYNGNEGFDDYHLKDFNKYLAAKYPAYTQSDWTTHFGMTASNYINNTNPLDDLTNNFNYRNYLASHGWQNNPLTSSNPLAVEWGRVLDNRADTSSNTFLANYTTSYWRDIVSQVREYARTAYGKEILITSNGLFPYVDFNGLGMYNYNQDNNGAEANYVPVSSGHLNGTFSLQDIFAGLYHKSRLLSGSAPVVLFIDWPTQMMTNYNNLPQKEKEDYWKIYAAEAYANGLFMAFHLKTSIGGDPTAGSQGVLSFFRDYAAFYRDNASFYHHNELLSLKPNLSVSGVNASVMLQQSLGRQTIHLVNHHYASGSGMTSQSNFTLSIPVDSIPKSVYVKSPDFSGYRVLNYNYNGTTLTISVDGLDYYDVIVVDYTNNVLGITDPVKTDMNDISIFPNPSNGSISINCSEECIFKGGIAKISDSTGKIVKEFVFNESQKYDLNLPTGIYYLIIRNGNFLNTKKFILN